MEELRLRDEFIKLGQALKAVGWWIPVWRLSL